MHNPRLIVCDEPTSAPDHETGHKVMELLKNVALDDTTQLPVYETAVKQTVHALGVLLEKEPGALLDLLNDEGKVSAAATAIVADLPSDLLRRRPDIRRAERQLAAATAQVGVATADLYPKVNLFAFLGLQNMTLVATEPVQGLGSNSSQVRMAAIYGHRAQQR